MARKRAWKLRLCAVDMQWIQNLHWKLTSGTEHNHFAQSESVEFTIIQFKWRKLSSTVQYLLYANIDLYVSVCERDNSIKTQIKPEWMHWDGVFSFSLRRGYNLPLFWIFFFCFFAKYTKRFFRCRSLQNKMNSFSWLVHFEFKSVYSSLSSVMSVRSGMVMDIRFYDNIKQFSAQIYLSLDFGTVED